MHSAWIGRSGIESVWSGKRKLSIWSANDNWCIIARGRTGGVWLL